MPDRSESMEPSELLAHTAFMKSLARAIVGGDESRADDLFQEAMLAALRKPPKPGIPFKAWITGVMRNLNLFKARTESRRARRESIAAQYALAGSSFPPDIVVQQEAERQRVIDAVLDLDDPDRSAILFRFYDNLTIREIAERTNVAEKTVQRRINRSLKKLSSRLDKEHGGDGRAWKLAIAPITGISLSELAAAETAYVAATTAVKAAGAGIATWLKGAAAVIITVAVSLTVLHFVQSDLDDESDNPIIAAGGAGQDLNPVGSANRGDGSAETASTDGQAAAGNDDRTPIESDRILLSFNVVDRFDPDMPVTNYHLVIQKTLGSGKSNHFRFDKLVDPKDGFFDISVPTGGTYDIQIHSADYFPYSINQLHVSNEAGRHEIEIPLDPGLVLHGKIIDDESNRPIANAIVASTRLNFDPLKEPASKAHWGWTKTGTDGIFELKGLSPEDAEVTLRASYPSFAAEFFSVDPQNSPLEIRLKKGFRISGCVKDDVGFPTNDAYLRITKKSRYSFSNIVRLAEDGTYQTAPFGPGHYQIDVYPNPGNESFSRDCRTVKIIDQDLQEVNFGPSDNCITWTGQLLYNGKISKSEPKLFLVPAQFRKNQDLDNPQFTREAKCDSQGRFTFNKISLGEFQLSALFDSGQELFSIQNIRFDQIENIEKDITLHGGTVIGKLDAGKKTPELVNSYIILIDESDDSTYISISPNSAGEFEFIAVPPGRYSIECELAFTSIDRVSDRMKFFACESSGQNRILEVVDGQSHEIVISLPPTGSIHLKGSGFFFSDLSFLKVEVFGPEENPHYLLYVRKWSDGNCTATRNLSPGIWTARVSIHNLGHKEFTIQVTDSQETELVVEKGHLQRHEWLKTATGSVLLPTGQPAAEIKLRFTCIEKDDSQKQQWDALHTRVDSRGHFTIDGLYPGRWVIHTELRPSRIDGRSRIIYFPSMKIESSDPATISKILVVPAGGVTGTLYDEKNQRPIQTSQASWTLSIYSGNEPVFWASDIETNELDIAGIPAGTFILKLKTRGYKPYEREFSLAEGEVRPLGDILLEPADKK